MLTEIRKKRGLMCARNKSRTNEPLWIILDVKPMLIVGIELLLFLKYGVRANFWVGNSNSSTQQSVLLFFCDVAGVSNCLVKAAQRLPALLLLLPGSYCYATGSVVVPSGSSVFTDRPGNTFVSRSSHKAVLWQAAGNEARGRCEVRATHQAEVYSSV
jgi:hypothetical protein